MWHSLGVTDSYIRFSEEQMLEDDLQGIEHLTVNQNIVLINRSIKQQSEYMQQSLKEIEEKHKKEIELLDEKYRDQLNKVNQDMIKAIKSQEEISTELIKFKDLFKIYIDSSSAASKEDMKVRRKYYTLEKNFSSVASSINDVINNKPEYQQSFKALLDNEG